MKFGLTENTYSEIFQVFQKYPGVEKVFIYGSRAMGNYRPGSDVDLAVSGATLSHRDILTIAADLDELGTLYRFDVLLYDKLNDPELKEHIDRVGQQFYLSGVEQN